MPDLWMQSMQDLRQGDQERGMRRLQQAIRKMHVREEIGKFQRSESLGLIRPVRSRPEGGRPLTAARCGKGIS